MPTPITAKGPAASLLSDYVAKQSDEAFTLIVQRFSGLVFSTAMVCLNHDYQLAEDATQTVFFSLARKAHRLPPDIPLEAWLYRHAYHTASKIARTEHRRKRRERNVTDNNPSEPNASPDLGPLVARVVTELTPRDRSVLIARFLEQKSLKETGQSLGISPDAARKRVSRALEKLRTRLKARGFAASGALLSELIGKQGRIDVPEQTLHRLTTSVSMLPAGSPLSIISKIRSSPLSKIAIVATGLFVSVGLTLKMRNVEDPRKSEPKELGSRLQVTMLPSNRQASRADPSPGFISLASIDFGGSDRAPYWEIPNDGSQPHYNLIDFTTRSLTTAASEAAQLSPSEVTWVQAELDALLASLERETMRHCRIDVLRIRPEKQAVRIDPFPQVGSQILWKFRNRLEAMLPAKKASKLVAAFQFYSWFNACGGEEVLVAFQQVEDTGQLVHPVQRMRVRSERFDRDTGARKGGSHTSYESFASTFGPVLDWIGSLTSGPQPDLAVDVSSPPYVPEFEPNNPQAFVGDDGILSGGMIRLARMSDGEVLAVQEAIDKLWKEMRGLIAQHTTPSRNSSGGFSYQITPFKGGLERLESFRSAVEELLGTQRASLLRRHLEPAELFGDFGNRLVTVTPDLRYTQPHFTIHQLKAHANPVSPSISDHIHKGTFSEDIIGTRFGFTSRIEKLSSAP